MDSVLSTLNKKIVFVAVVSALLLSAILGAEFFSLAAATSVESVVGVEVGDWVKYILIGSWASTLPDPELPPDLIEIDKIEWVKNTVLAISSTKITFERTAHYKDGNETVSVEYVDVKTGDSSPIGTLMFIPSNLTEGAIVYASLTEHYSINNTVLRTYVGASRETNQLNASTVLEDPPAVTIITTCFRWDRATGVLCERLGTYVDYMEDVMTSLAITERIVDTNLWVGQLNTPPVAEAGPDQIVIEDTSVSFDASASYDADGIIASYVWNFGDGTNGTDMKVTHIYEKPGTYIVTLTVKDVAGSIDTDTITVTVIVQETFPPSTILGVSVIVVGVAVALLFWRRKGKKLKRSKR